MMAIRKNHNAFKCIENALCYLLWLPKESVHICFIFTHKKFACLFATCVCLFVVSWGKSTFHFWYTHDHHILMFTHTLTFTHWSKNANLILLHYCTYLVPSNRSSLIKILLASLQLACAYSWSRQVHFSLSFLIRTYDMIWSQIDVYSYSHVDRKTRTWFRPRPEAGEAESRGSVCTMM